MRLPRGLTLACASALAFAGLGAGCNKTSEAQPAPPAAAAPAPGSVTPAPSDTSPGETGKLPGVDLTGLDPSQVKGLDRLLDEKPSPCGKSHSLRTSLKTDPKCRRSVFAVKFIVTLLKAGLLPSEAEEHYDQRFVSPEKGRAEVAQAPMKGNPHAPVSIVEFSDFQCPHCKLMAPALDKLLTDFPDQVKIYYKNYPISKLHPEAAEAATAAMAAHRQGKFWAMHDKLFGNQEKLGPADLERYAGELKLDVKKWKSDLAAAKEQVEKDHAEGEKLDLTGTPTIYINERKYQGPLRYEAVKDWVEEELNR